MPTNQSAVPRGAVVLATVFCLVLASVALVAAFHAHELRGQLEQANAELQQLHQAGSARPAAAAENSTKLREALRRQEAQYAQLRAEYEQLKNQAGPALSADLSPPPLSVAATNAAPASSSPATWLERLRVEDPDRYKQVQAEREKRRQQVAAQFEDELNHLDQRLQTAQTQEEVDLVTQLADTLTKVDDLRQRWQAIMDLPEDLRREQAQPLMAESRQTYQTLANLRAQDRQQQFQTLAGQVGYADPKASAQFVDSVNRIIKDTDTNFRTVFGVGPGMMRGQGGGVPASSQTPR